VLNDNKVQVSASLDALGKLGSEIATTEEITKKLKMLELSGIKIPPQIYEKVKTIPKNISYKQLIFFSFLDDMLAPKIFAQLSTMEKAMLSKGQVLDLASMRAGIYFQVKNELDNFIAITEKIIK
jgi:hypothetical protein